MYIHVCVIDQARGQNGWILAKLSFCVFMDRDEDKGFITWHKERWKNDLHTCLFLSTEKEASYLQKWCFFLCRWQFSHFLVPSRQRNHRNSFYCHWNTTCIIFLQKKPFVHPLGRATSSRQYRPILPARVANQNIEFTSSCPLAELAI